MKTKQNKTRWFVPTPENKSSIKYAYYSSTELSKIGRAFDLIVNRDRIYHRSLSDILRSVEMGYWKEVKEEEVALL